MSLPIIIENLKKEMDQTVKKYNPLMPKKERFEFETEIIDVVTRNYNEWLAEDRRLPFIVQNILIVKR